MKPLTDPSDPVLSLLLGLPLLEETDPRINPYPYVRAANPKILVWRDGDEDRSDVQLYGLGTQGGQHQVTAMWLLRGLYQEKARYANPGWKEAVLRAYAKLGGVRADLERLRKSTRPFLNLGGPACSRGMTTTDLASASLAAPFTVVRDGEEVALTIACWQDRDGTIEALRAFDAQEQNVDLDGIEDQAATDTLLRLHDLLRSY